jgi:mannose-1-phosphate guanylyltransferase
VLYANQFKDVVLKAIDFSQNHNSLLTIGIKPTRPETGYGYIQMCNDCEKLPDWIKKVKVFTEKPDLEMATFFVESEEFLWNSGIFIWTLKSILSAFNSYLPEMVQLFNNEEIYDTDKEVLYIDDIYKKVQTVSIDIGIMEKAENVFVLPAEFGWSDLGTWGSLYDSSINKDKDKNVTNSKNIFLYNTKNSIINVPSDKLVVVNGLENIIIAESDDLLLISTLKDEQNIRQIVTDIKVEKGEKFV